MSSSPGRFGIGVILIEILVPFLRFVIFEEEEAIGSTSGNRKDSRDGGEVVLESI